MNKRKEAKKMNDFKKRTPFSYFIDEGKLRIIVAGEIDHHSAKVIRDGIDELIFEYRPSALYINFSEVDFMDSSGLGLIMGRYKLMKIYGGKTYIEDPSLRVLKIIELAQMNRIIEVVSSAETNDKKERGEENEKNEYK